MKNLNASITEFVLHALVTGFVLEALEVDKRRKQSLYKHSEDLSF
jgi:hypothetical protein